MTVKVLLDVQLKSDSLDDAYAGIHDTLVETRQRPGAISVDVLIDADDPSRVLLIETWEAIEDQKAYLAWRATPEGTPTKMLAVVAGPPVSRTFSEAPEI